MVDWVLNTSYLFSPFSANLMNTNAVEDTLKTVMGHALKVNPTQPSWLRTQADIYFGEYAVPAVLVKVLLV